MPEHTVQQVHLPIDLFDESIPVSGARAGAPGRVCLSVPNDYEVKLQECHGKSEVVALQRLLTLARGGRPLEVHWQHAIAAKAATAAPIFPLLCALLLLESVQHWIVNADGSETEFPLSVARRKIQKHQLAADLFADSDTVMCADSLGHSPPADLYEPQSGRLRTREDFETLVVQSLAAQMSRSVNDAFEYQMANALGLIVAELFENTDMHGRFDLDGRPIATNALRGLLFKRIKLNLQADRITPAGLASREVDCFEISVFDTGLGYFSSYTREVLDEAVELQREWQVLHNCLERHYYPKLADHRAGHRAMGLYEVLKAIQYLHGRIEFRTGRLYGFRTFLPGEPQSLMQPREGFARKSWPIPKLLDVDKKYAAIPSRNELLIGSSVRVIIPLDAA